MGRGRGVLAIAISAYSPRVTLVGNGYAITIVVILIRMAPGALASMAINAPRSWTILQENGIKLLLFYINSNIIREKSREGSAKLRLHYWIPYEEG